MNEEGVPPEEVLPDNAENVVIGTLIAPGLSIVGIVKYVKLTTTHVDLEMRCNHRSAALVIKGFGQGLRSPVSVEVTVGDDLFVLSRGDQAIVECYLNDIDVAGGEALFGIRLQNHS